MFSLKTMLFLLLLFISVRSLAQKNKDAVTVSNCPVRKGYARLFNNKLPSLADRGMGISIYSKESDVFAVKTGVVIKVFTVDDFDNVFVKSGDTAIVYGNLDKPQKKVGDTIRLGEFIGKMKKTESEDEYELYFVIMAGRKEILDENYLTFLKRFK